MYGDGARVIWRVARS